MTSMNETQSEKVASNQELVGPWACLGVAAPFCLWQCEVFRAVLG